MKALRVGSRGLLVKRVQKKVGVTADGVFGAATSQAVKRWQRANKLTADGVVGPLTWAKMFPILSKIVRQKPLVVLDIGHGKNNRTPGVYDPGAVSGGHEEHKDVAGLVYALKAALEARGRAVRVITDMAVTSRDDYAARAKAFRLVSNHLNAGGGHGCEVIVAKNAGTGILALAQRVSATIARTAGIKNRGAYRDVRGLAMFNALPQRTMLIEWYYIDAAGDRAEFDTRTEIVSAVTAVAAIL